MANNKLKRLYISSKGRCFYCLKQIPYEKATIDHKEPRARGGSNGLTNLVLSCMKCNKRKGDMPFVIYMQRNYPWRLKVVHSVPIAGEV